MSPPIIHAPAIDATATRFPLLRHLSISSLTAMIFTSAILIFLYQQDQVAEHEDIAAQENEKTAIHLQQLLEDHIVTLISTTEKLDTPALQANPQVGLFSAALQSVQEHHVLKLKIFNPSGIAIYASIAEEIGKPSKHPERLAEALHGKTVHKLEFRPTILTASGELHDRYIAKAYVPLMHAGKRIGALELDADSTPIIQRIYSKTISIALIVVGAFAALFGGLFFTLLRTDRAVVRWQKEIADHSHKLTESEARFRNMANEAPALIWMTDEKNSGIWYNKRWMDFTGRTLEQELGMGWIEGMHPDDRERCATFCQAAFDARQRFDMEFRLRRADGTYRWMADTGTPRFDDGENFLGYIGYCWDITERKKSADEIKHLAYFDPLTGLANRRLLTDRMEQALAQARRYGELVAVCMIDLDGFKQVNDQLGHKAGDQLLIEVARRLPECIRESDSASRFGGDEFSVILGGFTNISECELSLKRISASLGAPYLVGGEIAHVTASIGATIYPNDGASPDLLLRHADQAMYEAKHAGKNCFRLFNPSHLNQQLANQATIKKIEKALAEGQLVLFYQPQVDCRLGKVVGMEALLRWNHPTLGLMAPSEFIPLLEKDDLIITVGEWVIRETLRQLQEWQLSGFDLMISVNISARHLHQDNFAARLRELLAGYDASVINRLGIEILETAALEDVNTVAEAVHHCRALGVHVAMDDFGTGYSSLAHLKNLNVDVLKIDQSFILGMLRNPGDLAIVSGVIALGASFRHQVIAEGVESTDQVLMLMEMGCDQMQGFVISRPIPADQVPAWISAFMPNPLWKLSSSARPSRNYFELLLAQTNHRHWINQHVESSGDENCNPDFLLDHKQCHFGHWYYEEGLPQFDQENWFRSIEPLHQQVHQTAARLCRYKRTGNMTEVQIEEANLLVQQNQLDSLLYRTRGELAGAYLLVNTNTPNGESK